MSEIRPVSVNYRMVGDDYAAAGDYLSRNQADVYAVTRPFIPEVAGGLTVGEPEQQMLRLVGKYGVGAVQRHVARMKEGVSVSTSPANGVDVVLHPERWDSKLLSRGLAWIRVYEEAPPVFVMNVLPEHGITDKEVIARRFDAAELCAHIFILDVSKENSFILFSSRSILPDPS